MKGRGNCDRMRGKILSTQNSSRRSAQLRGEVANPILPFVMSTNTSHFSFRRPPWQPFALAILMAALTRPGLAQGVGGGSQNAASNAPPAASLLLKRTTDRSDPLDFLLEKKKSLNLSKMVEDSIKNYRKEMRHMQDVVFKDLDALAVKKDPAGQPPSITVVMSLTKDADDRVKDIQSAYRDRAHALLDEKQKHQIDSLEAIWKRDGPKRDLKPIVPPPPPGG